MMKIILFIVIAIILKGSKAAIPLLDEDIGQEIFHQNKYYVIYVSFIPSEQVIVEFDKFCQNGKLCAILNGENQMYQHIINFVGFHYPDYFLIFDIQNRLKYCLQIRQPFKVDSIQDFFQKFQKGTLEPYYTSESIPEQQKQEYMTKIVGLTFQQFLDEKDKVRVLYLYTESQLCDNCLKVYQELAENAKNFLNYPIHFAYLDLFKNQHKLLKEQNVPLILIYSKNSRNYQKITVDQREKLEAIIRRQLGKDSQEDL